MSYSPTIFSALAKIAELASSSRPAEERLDNILAIGREALGIDALSIVAFDLDKSEPRVWTSSAPGITVDASFVTRLAIDAFSELDCSEINKEHPSTHFSESDQRFVIPVLKSKNGVRAAIVALGASNEAANSPFFSVLKSFVSLIVENDWLACDQQISSSVDSRSMEEIAAIYEIGQAMDASDVQPVLDMIVAKACSVMDAQACSLMLRQSSRETQEDELVIRASWGLADEIVKGTRVSLGDAIAGRVAQTGEPVLINDVANDPRFSDVIPRSGISGSMCVPLKSQDGTVLGVLSIRRHEPNPPFTEDDLKLFGVFATHAALALSNAELYTRLHLKIDEMSAISDVLRAINSTLDLDQVLDRIVEGITGVVGFDRCCVYLLDSRTNEFVAGARKGYKSTDNLIDRIAFGEGVIGLAAKEHIPIFSSGSPVESEGSGRSGDFLVAPIIVRDECIGVVVVDNCILNRPIEPQHVELLATFVSQAGIAVENARLYEAMEEKYAELNVLYEHSRSLSAAYGLDNVAEILVANASRAVRCDGAGLLLLDQRRNSLSFQATAGSMSDRVSELDNNILEDKAFVDFVRELRTPLLLEPDNPERVSSLSAAFLNAIAPRDAHLLLAPLVTEDITIGTLVLYRNRADEFQGSELKLASIITSHAATVIKNAINYEQKMRQRVLELSALYEFSKEISSAANLEQALDSILAIVANLVESDESFIYTIDHERQVATVKASRFRDNTTARSERPASMSEEPLDGESVISWTIRERKAFISPDISCDMWFSSPFSCTDGESNNEQSPGSRVRSLMAIPLMVHDQVVGVLSVHSYSPNQYSEDDVRVLSIVASQGAAIYNELEALSALTSYTDNILSSIAAGVVTLASDGTVLTWNSAAERIVGIKASQVVELHYEDVIALLQISDADRENLKTAIQSVLETGETYQGYKLCFHPTVSRVGQDEESPEEVYINMSISQLLNSAGEQLGLVIIFEDITHEIRMENEFRKMGELAAVGQLAASIAHELRNPLSSIKGAAQFLKNEYEDYPSIGEFLGIIIEEVNGLNKLTTEFLDFARPMQLDLKPTSVNKVVEKTLQLMSVHITDNNVVVKEALSESVPEVQADEAQLEQVLKNIIINALQAMPEGGVLTIETGPTASGGAYMAVSDTGVGIPPDKIDRIFQPFVTTKTKGTGLGLSVVHKIVDNHGGRVEVTSEVGKGSTFKVILPRTGLHTIAAADYNHTLERRVSGKLRTGNIEV
jgi:PAS domain S-box-containing protein